MNNTQERVIKYYNHPETRIGFNVFLNGSKHFGYYPEGKSDISEQQAQILLQDLVGEKLKLQKDEIALDAGCGQGVVSTYLAKKFQCKIFGITLVPFEVVNAKNLAAKFGVSETTDYMVMDYSQTTFPDNYFDAIYTTETLSHSPNIDKTLAEFFRILKPGGRFAFFEYTIAPDDQFSNHEMKMFNVVMEGSAMVGLKDFRHDKFPSKLTDAGFDSVREENITKNIKPSLERFSRIAKWPYKLVRLFGLQRFFVNTTAAYEYLLMAKKGLVRYSIFTGSKKI